ncbi:MAG: BLUF domain-containing protein [Pseudomonadota bacterium]|jgi:hypothetical protein|nr:BLUF domain-containing protein [Pseudomonadota bacterium]
MFLCRLAFFSRRNWYFDTPDENNGILRSILGAGLRNNAKRGLSGVLVVDGNLFVQILEGPRVTLSNTFCRIQNDSRHGGLVLTGFEEVPERLFPDWSVVVRDAPKALREVPWIPEPEAATFDTLVHNAHRLLKSGSEFKRIQLERELP